MIVYNKDQDKKAPSCNYYKTYVIFIAYHILKLNINEHYFILY